MLLDTKGFYLFLRFTQQSIYSAADNHTVMNNYYLTYNNRYENINLYIIIRTSAKHSNEALYFLSNIIADNSITDVTFASIVINSNKNKKQQQKQQQQQHQKQHQKTTIATQHVFHTTIKNQSITKIAFIFIV